MKKYQILEGDKFNYISLVLLNEIINFQHYFSVRPRGEEIFIERYLKFMYERGVLSIENDVYIPTALGREQLVNLYAKFYEYLKIYDIFSAVDLEKGEFAFSSSDLDMSDEQWADFINEERFSDVRVAVAEFKSLNPIEIVFMSFLSEDRFAIGGDRWEYALTGDAIWSEIEDICNTAVSAEYLMEDNVLENVIREGTEIMLGIIKMAQEIEEEEIEEDEYTEYIEYVEIVEMPVYEYEYFDPYYDPYYVSPIWLVPVVLLW